MVLITDSSIETSIKVPRLPSFFASAAEIAKAAVIPPMVSAMGKPTLKGAVSASPVMLIVPDMP